jgi:hypothetical protein
MKAPAPIRYGRRYAAPLFFLFTLVVLEVLSRRVVARYTVRGGIAQLDGLTAVIRGLERRPVVLFLGTSHVRSGIVPAVIERRLGLPRGAVLSAGLGGASPYELRRLYETNERTLGAARLALVEVAPMYFSRVRAVASRLGLDLHTRLHFPARPLARADWLLGWALAAWDTRRAWRDLATSAGQRALRGVGLGGAPFDADGYPTGPSFRSPRGDHMAEAERVLRAQFEPYSFDHDVLRDFVTLLGRMEANGTRVVLVEYPAAPVFEVLLQRRYPQAMRDEEAALAGPLSPYPVLRVSSSQEKELEDEFQDSHHLSRAGAERFSAMLAELPEVRGVRDVRATEAH